MKKQTIRVLALVCLIGITTFWQSCQEDPIDVPNDPVEVSFNIIASNTATLKNTPLADLENAQKVILTIQKCDGTPTDFIQHELDIYKLGDADITGKIALLFGSYKITEFYVLDDLDNIVYTSPLEGSLMAQNVTDPLPVLFNVSQKKSKAVEVEVVSTANLQAEDFGLVRFPITEVETFQFLISVSEQGMEKLLKAGLTVSSNGYSYTQELDSIVDNKLTIKDGYEEYALTITAIGYGTYKGTFTNAELKQYTIIPLIIELEYLTVTDIDGNVYKAVQIGDQVWMAENLRVTKFNDGTQIPNETNNDDFLKLTTPAYCWYNHDSITYANPYGALYNWHTVETGKLCPVGWHVSEYNDWITLENYLGGNAIVGGKLKEVGYSHWSSPNIGATNQIGFTALPGGILNITTNFDALSYVGCWWTSTSAWRVWLHTTQTKLQYSTYVKSTGSSVRCLKD